MKPSEELTLKDKIIVWTIMIIGIVLVFILPIYYTISEVNERNNEVHEKQLNFIKIHGSSKIVSCESGFLMEHTAFKDDLVYNDTTHSPVRCSDNVNIQVKETARTGLLAGDVN